MKAVSLENLETDPNIILEAAGVDKSLVTISENMPVSWTTLIELKNRYYILFGKYSFIIFYLLRTKWYMIRI